ncbi:hypothetical protein AcW1_009222 [Taiwanofungus camphoratus]|nr:hypothetical protein AcW1_009222 [Antrodia cinnamomea]
MFSRQLAVVKGQAWNIVQSLKHADEGPLELTRRQKVLVWDDEVEVTDDMLSDIANGAVPPSQPPTASPHASVNTMPLPKRIRSQSASEFPPPMRRVSSECPGGPRPVSFSTKFSLVHPATTGVTVLEHMERLDAVEAGLKRLGVEESVVDDDEEVDVGEASCTQSASTSASSSTSKDQARQSSTDVLSPSARSERLPAVPEDVLSNSMTEEDMIAMSKSTSQLEVSPSILHTRWPNHGGQSTARPSLDWMQVTVESPKQRLMVVERLETVNTKPMFSCC